MKILDSIFNYLQVANINFFFEVLILYLLLYYFIRFCEGTRGAGILKGILILSVSSVVAFLILSQFFLDLSRLETLLTHILPTSLIALVIILQPELRRGLSRLSQAPIFGEFLQDEHEIVSEIIKAVFRLSKNRVGGLIAIEREDSLQSFVERGISIDGEVQSELITTIFYPGTDLHDGAIVIQKGRIAAAGSLFPLSENPQLGSWAGTRHRAGVGLTEECDAITVVVSEERGEVSLCVRGKIHRNLGRDELEHELTTYYAQLEVGELDDPDDEGLDEDQEEDEESLPQEVKAR